MMKIFAMVGWRITLHVYAKEVRFLLIAMKHQFF